MAKSEIKGVTMTLPTGRVSYPHIFKPRANDLKGGKLEYRLNVVWGPGADLGAVDDAIFKAAAEMFGSDSNAWPKSFANPFRNNEEKWKKDEKTGQPIPDPSLPAGGFHLSPWTSHDPSKPGPKVYDENLNQILDETGLYGGCHANVAVTFKAYKHVSGTCGVTCYLVAVQKVKDDTPFGVDRKPENFFKPVEQPAAAVAGGAKTAGALFGRGRTAAPAAADPMA